MKTVLRNENREIVQKALKKIDFSAIVEDDFGIEVPKKGLFNVIDLQSAIEIYNFMFVIDYYTSHGFFIGCIVIIIKVESLRRFQLIVFIGFAYFTYFTYN